MARGRIHVTNPNAATGWTLCGRALAGVPFADRKTADCGACKQSATRAIQRGLIERAAPAPIPTGEEMRAQVALSEEIIDEVIAEERTAAATPAPIAGVATEAEVGRAWSCESCGSYRTERGPASKLHDGCKPAPAAPAAPAAPKPFEVGAVAYATRRIPATAIVTGSKVTIVEVRGGKRTPAIRYAVRSAPGRPGESTLVWVDADALTAEPLNLD